MILCLAAPAPPAAARTLHVSAQGDDQADGSAWRPWKTIQRAADAVQPGDTIVIHAGTYRESVIVSAAGTAAAPITFTAAEGEKPVLSGAEPLAGPWEDLGGGVFRTALPPGRRNFGWLFVDGPPARYVDGVALLQPGDFTVGLFGPAWDKGTVAPDTRPDEGEAVAGGAKWQAADAAGGVLDLDALFGGRQKNSLVFAATYIHCPSDQPGAFRYAADPVRRPDSKQTFSARYDGSERADEMPHRMRVWVNGRLITDWDNHVPRARRLNLKMGWNTVLVQMACGEKGPWRLNPGITAQQYGQAGGAALFCQARRPAEGSPPQGQNRLVDGAGGKLPPAIGQWLVAGPLPDPSDGKIYIRLPEGRRPDGQSLEWATRPLVLQVKQTSGHVRLRGLTFCHAANRYQDAMVDFEAPFAVADGCEVRDCLGRGIRAFNDSTIRDCRILRCGCVGIGGGNPPPDGLARVQVLDNVVAGNNWRLNSTGNEAGGMKLCRLRNSTIRGNRVADNLAWGIWLDWECRGNRIERNFLRDNRCAGIFIEASRGDNLIANNIVIGSRFAEPGAEWADGIYVQDAGDARILHNLCLNNAACGIRIALMTDRTLDDGRPVASSDNTVVNNICAGNGRVPLSLPKNGPRTRGNTSDGNVLVPGPKGAVAAPSYTLKKWQETGQDAHSTDAPPRFGGAGQDDYHPAAGSSAIGTGAPQPDVPADYDGRPRQGSTATAGPFEHE